MYKYADTRPQALHGEPQKDTMAQVLKKEHLGAFWFFSSDRDWTQGFEHDRKTFYHWAVFSTHFVTLKKKAVVHVSYCFIKDHTTPHQVIVVRTCKLT